MKIFKYIFLLFPFLFISNSFSYIDKDTAVIRVLNKAAGKVQKIEIPLNKSIEYEKLTLTVKSCKQTDPFDAENFFMFIEIDKDPDGRIFSNWMNRNEPGENPLQNPDYDVWLEKCL